MRLFLSNGAPAGEARPGSREKTVVVGVKLDQQSRELLTWALVKVAQPGDQVVALHVLGHDDAMSPNGRSSLLSLVRAFDSVLAVYEGFCNLKQVDLKLKICRGASIRKILVREAKQYSAAKVIVGITEHHGPIGSPTSVAKYCSKKLPRDCSVIAVNNGKIIYQREEPPADTCPSPGTIREHLSRTGSLLTVIQRSFSRSSKVLNEEGGDSKLSPGTGKNHCAEQTLEHILGDSGSKEKDVLSPKCWLCATKTEKDADHEHEGRPAMPMVPTSPASAPMQELPVQSPGWPLLRQAAPSERAHLEKSPTWREMSVVQWAMGLPSRRCVSSNITPDNHEPISPREDEEDLPVGSESATATPPDEEHSRSVPKELERLLHEKYSSVCRLFKYDELAEATSDFLAENLVGRGGNSEVYKGRLRDGKEIAVKMLLNKSDYVLEEFVLEIEIITTLNHKNITPIIGFCIDSDHLLLVHDLVGQGSLEDHLYGCRRGSAALGWGERYKVALGVARALDYLHNHDGRPVIHRDVKSSNILLFDDFEAQLCDFGLAKWASTTSTSITCPDVAGTFGYLAPEYFMYGKINDKIDVYAFGVVLLELLSGRKPISSDLPKGQESLVMWAKPILDGGKVSELLDPSLGDKYDHDQIERMVLAATLCIRRAPRARPQMSLVFKLLRGDEDATIWARRQVSSEEESDLLQEDDQCTISSIQSHLNLALHDVEDDSLSMGIIEQNVSLEDYLHGRWSRSSSFD